MSSQVWAKFSPNSPRISEPGLVGSGGHKRIVIVINAYLLKNVNSKYHRHNNNQIVMSMAIIDEQISIIS